MLRAAVPLENHAIVSGHGWLWLQSALLKLLLRFPRNLGDFCSGGEDLRWCWHRGSLPAWLCPMDHSSSAMALLLPRAQEPPVN